MHDANKIEAVIDRVAWPSLLSLSIVRPSLLVPSLWYPYGWEEPATSKFCNLAVMNVEHANAAMMLRLPNMMLYFASLNDELSAYWFGTGDYHGLDEEDSARMASITSKSTWEAITDAGNRQKATETYQKLLSIYVASPGEAAASNSPGPFAPWVVLTLLIVGGIMITLILVLALSWMLCTYLEQRTLRAVQEMKWKVAADDAENSANVLSFPLVLVNAVDFLRSGSFVPYERLRDERKLAVLDTLGKIERFRENCFIIFPSCEWLDWGLSSPKEQDYETMCSAVRAAAEMLCTGAELDMTKIFFWAHFCSNSPATPCDPRSGGRFSATCTPLRATCSSLLQHWKGRLPTLLVDCAVLSCWLRSCTQGSGTCFCVRLLRVTSCR